MRATSFLRLTLCFTLAAVGALGSQVLPADEPPVKQPTAPAGTTETAKPDQAQSKDEVEPEPFDQVHKQWKTVEESLDGILQQFRKAPAGEREVLREKYLVQVEEAKRIVPRLRRAALAEYRAAPNKNPDVVRALVGILANDVRNDDYRPALEITKVLVENQAPEDAILTLAGLAAFSTDDFTTAGKFFQAAKAKDALDDQNAQGYLDQIEAFKTAWKAELAVRAAEAQADDLPRVKLVTNKGTLVIELFENEAPKAVANFVNLIEKGYYNGLAFHRVLPNFMAQGGCPKGDGTGGPGYNIPCECKDPNFRHHFSGTLSMAHAGANTGGSQFFLTFRPTPHLDGRHTAFGRVIEGMDVLPKLQRRDPQRNPVEPDKIISAEVLRKRDHEYVLTKTKNE